MDLNDLISKHLLKFIGKGLSHRDGLNETTRGNWQGVAGLTAERIDWDNNYQSHEFVTCRAKVWVVSQPRQTIGSHFIDTLIQIYSLPAA